MLTIILTLYGNGRNPGRNTNMLQIIIITIKSKTKYRFFKYVADIINI